MPLRATLSALLLVVPLLACAQPGGAALTITPAGGDATPVPATLRRPDGAGPFPAIVIMHDCSGLGARSSGAPDRWTRHLVAQGYVVLIPDSFTPRGFPDGVCTIPGRDTRSVSAYVRAGDAYGALAYLRTLPFVDGSRVGVMGGSHGGATTLAAMFEPVAADAPLAAAKRDGFAAAIALYPSCGSAYGSWSVTRQNGATGPITGYRGVYKPIAPLLILIGERDDWTPAEPCRRLAEASQAAGYTLDLKVYPGAQHSFDSYAPIRYVAERNNINAPDGRGATTGGNPDAWADAREQVTAFFARILKGSK
jgi:dienelactone hydrolase